MKVNVLPDRYPFANGCFFLFQNLPEQHRDFQSLEGSGASSLEPVWYIWHLQSMHALFVNIWILKDAVIRNCEFETFQFPLRRKNLVSTSIFKYPSATLHVFHSTHCPTLLSSFPHFPFIHCILLAKTPQHLFPPLTQFYLVQSGHTLAVINIGAPAGGMSTAVRAFVRFSLYQGHTVLGIRDGINGLFDDKVMNTRYSFDPQITDANRGGSIFSLLNWI